MTTIRHFFSRNHKSRRLTKICPGPCRAKDQARCITRIMMYIAAAASLAGKKSADPFGVSRRVRLFPPQSPPPDPKSHPSGRRWFNEFSRCQNLPFPARGRGLSLFLINKHPLPHPTGGEPDTMPPPTHTHTQSLSKTMQNALCLQT